MRRTPAAGAAAAGRCYPGIATRGLYSFEGAVSVARPVGSTPGAPPAPHRRWGSPEPPRPARKFSPAQLDALAQLQALGATLAADFTRHELRAVFRALALAYHPDRHPGTTAADKARLAGTFVAVRRAYDVLKTVA